MCVQNLKFVALPVLGIIGVHKKFGQFLDTCMPLFSKTFNGLLFGWTLWMYRPNLKSVALPVPEIIAIDILRLANPQFLERGGRRGPGMVPVQRAYVNSYKPSIVTFPLSLPFQRYCRTTFVLQPATFSHFTSSVPKISRCSIGNRWMAFGLGRAKVLS